MKEQLPDGMKRCAKCREIKPLSMFSRRKEGYKSYCKPCSRSPKTIENIKRRTAIPEGMKQCTKCKQVKPLEMYSLSSRDGRKSHCKVCCRTTKTIENEKRRLAVPEGMKRCAKCDGIYPLEMFHRSKHRTDGHISYCDQCRLTPKGFESKRQRLSDPEGTKWCPACKSPKPYDMFYKLRTSKSGFYGICKTCSSQKQKIYNQAYPDRVRARHNKWRSKNRDKLNRTRAAWRARNKDRINEKRRKYLKRYYQDNRERLTLYRQEWARINRDHLRDYKHAYHIRNRDVIIARVKAWQKAHPDKVKAWQKAWRKAHPETERAKLHRRRSRLKGNGGSFTAKDIAHMQHIQQGHCAYCGRIGQRLQIEHIIPAVQSGPSDPWNLCLACRRCNLNKGPRTPEQWVKRWYLPEE